MGSGPLAHPFRLAANGHMLTRSAGSDDDINDRLQLIIGTVQDERPMFPSYGIPDPVFVGISAGDIQACISEFGPEGIVIDDFEMEPVDARISNVHIHWSVDDEDEDGEEFEDDLDGTAESDFEDYEEE